MACFNNRFLSICLLVLAQTAAAATLPDAAVGAAEESCEAPWSVEYRVSGGFAGMRQLVRIQDDGRYSALDERSHRQQTGVLTPPEIESLSRLMHAVYQEPPSATQNSQCRDCIIHDVKLTVSGEERGFLRQSGDPLTPDMTALLQQLSRYLPTTR